LRPIIIFRAARAGNLPDLMKAGAVWDPPNENGIIEIKIGLRQA
jgi:hypothetical protein